METRRILQLTRIITGMTHRELANRAGINRTTIGLIETGQRLMNDAQRQHIEAALGITLDNPAIGHAIATLEQALAVRVHPDNVEQLIIQRRNNGQRTHA